MSRDAIEALAFAAAKRFRAGLKCQACANERASGYGTVTLGEHPVLRRLWIQASRLSHVRMLTRIERDILKLAGETHATSDCMALPVSLWRLSGTDGGIQVTTRLWVLDELRKIGSDPDSDGSAIVTVSLDAFIEILRAAVTAPDSEQQIAKIMQTTGIDRAGAEQALRDGKRTADALKTAWAAMGREP